MAKAKAGDSVEVAWKGVRKLQESRRVHSNTAWAGSGGAPSHKLADLCESLILVHAYGVLSRALEDLHGKGRFRVKKPKQAHKHWRPSLEALMVGSKQSKLPWTHYALIHTGKVKRNAIAHDGKYFPRLECWKLINAIEAELVAWGYALKVRPHP